MRIPLKAIVFLCTLLVSQTTLACYAPTGGPKYDALIKIELVKPNQYRIQVPRMLESGLLDAEVILAYSKQNPGGIPVHEPYERVETKVVGDDLVGEFTVRKKDGRPYINVMWWHEQPGMCGINAHTSFLEVQ